MEYAWPTIPHLLMWSYSQWTGPMPWLDNLTPGLWEWSSAACPRQQLISGSKDQKQKTEWKLQEGNQKILIRKTFIWPIVVQAQGARGRSRQTSYLDLPWGHMCQQHKCNAVQERFHGGWWSYLSSSYQVWCKIWGCILEQVRKFCAAEAKFGLVEFMGS